MSKKVQIFSIFGKLIAAARVRGVCYVTASFPKRRFARSAISQISSDGGFFGVESGNLTDRRKDLLIVRDAVWVLGQSRKLGCVPVKNGLVI